MLRRLSRRREKRQRLTACLNPFSVRLNVADGEIIGSPSRPVIFCGHSATAQGYTVKSTPESWRDNVARLVAGNPSMVTAIAAAFAAPMLALT